MRDAHGRQATVVLCAGDGRESELGRLPDRVPDLALVGALARLQLRARRRGGHLRLRDTPEALRDLLRLVGLDDVLRLEAGGEPEGLEVLGADEVVQADDLRP